MQKRKLLRFLLVMVLLLTQTTSFGSAASVPSNGTDANSIYSDPNNAMLGSSLNSQQPALDSTANTLANYYINYWKNNSWDWLRRTQFSGSFANGSSPQWAFSTIQPFNNIDNSLEKVWYGSGGYTANTSTMNLGMGYRQMNSKHSNVYGANLFYDNQFNINDLGNGATSNAMFQRLGLGLEYFTGSIEATVNGYLGISAPVMVANNVSYQTWQNVANGWDVNLKSNFDYFHAPWLNLTLTGYQYFGSMPNSVMANGGNFGGLAAQLGWQVTPQLSLNVGQDFGRQTTTAGFNLNLLASPQPATLFADQTINNNATKDLSYKMMQQPQRSSTIALEQYTKNNSATVTLTFTDENDQPLANMPVSLTPRVATGAVAAVGGSGLTAVTNVMGIAVFNYVTPGDYAVGLPSGYSYLASYITVVAGQPAFAIVASVINPSEFVDIQVRDAQGNALTNATVTVENIYVPIKKLSNGWFTIDYLPAGSYSGTASCAGYADTTFSFWVGAGGRGHEWVTLNKAVSSIAVTPSTASVDIGGTQQFTATATYADSTTANVTSNATWCSSNATVATIASGGIATGVTSGASSITATYGGKTATAVLNVNDSVTSIAVTPVGASVDAGTAQQYTATATYHSGATGDVTSSATWSSSDTAVATVTSGGLATGVTGGTSSITATYGGQTATVTLTVNDYVTLIAITPVNAGVDAGKTQQYTATATYTSGKTLDISSSAEWSSSDTIIATIAPGGLASGMTPGTAKITAKYGGITSSAAVLTVNDAIRSIAVTPGSANIYPGQTQPYTATATYTSGKTLDITSIAVWSSSDTSAATIATGGLASGVAAGTTAITAMFDSVSSPEVTLEVQANIVKSVAVTPVSASIYPGSTQQYIARATYSNGDSFDVTSSATWSSGNTGIATIATGGLASAVAAGATAISATLGSVSSPEVTLTVQANIVTSVAVTPVSASIYPGNTHQYTATATYSNGDIVDVTSSATWSSGNMGIATIASGGLASGVATGSAAITATRDGVSSAQVTLTVKGDPAVSLTITPTTFDAAWHDYQYFEAKEVLQSGREVDVTSSVTWGSTNTSVAYLASASPAPGKFYCAGQGTTGITASLGTLVAPQATLNVN